MSVATSGRSVRINSLARANILDLKGYSSSYGKNSLLTKERLHANESPFSWVSTDKYAETLNRYPSPSHSLNKLLAEIWGVSPEQLCLCRGSGEGIDILIRVFCNPGKDSVLSFSPGFDLYRFYSQINGVRYETLRRDPAANFNVSLCQIVEACTQNTRLIFLCNPDNPTGQFTEASDIINLLNILPEGVILVVDEAYIDFSGSTGMSFSVNDFQNLIVLRTLSKAWGLAGVRCGGIIAHPEALGLCKRILAPYPHSSPALTLTEELIRKSGRGYYEDTVKQTVQLRERLAHSLRKSHKFSQILDSKANFLFVKPRDFTGFDKIMQANGILVRFWDSFPGGWVRISVGNHRQVELMEKVL